MRRPRMRHLPLRSRLAIMSAAAVAVAIAAVAAISWFAVRSRLYDQVDKSILGAQAFFSQDVAPGPGLPPVPEPIGKSPCDAPFTGAVVGAGDDGGRIKLPTPAVNVTFILPDGTSCAGFGSTPVVLTAQDKAFATSPAAQGSYWRNGKDADGRPVRILVEKHGDRNGTRFAAARSQSVAGVQDSMTSLAWLLLLVSGLGVMGAATAGLLVARAALRPVDRLTDAVEHVARTEDLTVRMPVEGDDEIARLSASFNAMTAALEASREEQKRLVDDAGHELRTPLTSLRTTIDLLIRSDESGRAIPADTRRDLLTGARTQMRELTVLIADLLELSRPERGRGSEPAGPVALDEVVARAVERVRPRGLAREEGPVEVRLSTEPWTVRGDEPALERAVVNLLDNAVKFSPAGEKVDVILRGGELTVRDRGPGIPAEELPHVFERFWRSPSARAMPGSGLGLAIAARAVREAGGTVELATAADGPGVVARVRVPGR